LVQDVVDGFNAGLRGGNSRHIGCV
jgi:hypothetical protein